MPNGDSARGPAWTGTIGRWVDRAVSGIFVVVFGIVLGIQYMAPDKRVLSLLAGIAIAGIAWRLDIIAGLGVLIVALPFPKGMSFGTTNLALVLLLGIIYLLRFAQRELPRPRPTPLDIPVVGLVIAYVVSFSNVAPEYFGAALAATGTFAGTLLMFFVVVNSIRTEADLRRVHVYQALSIVAISIIALWELANPGKALVPGWIDFTSTAGQVFNTRDVRIGATFYDYELFADFCGLNVIFLVFLVVRAQDTLRRGFYIGLLTLTVFLMFATVTRGPIVSLAVALAYMMWLMRRRLKVVPVTIGAAVITATVIAANFVVANFTASGDLFARLSKTEVNGLVPDDRATAWKDGWEHFLLHPLIGNGPYYAIARGIHMRFYPHELYLYVANIVGLFGLVFFVWMLWKLFELTAPRVDTPAGPSYLEAYLFVARVQIVFFLVDQVKIEYLRNATYQYEVWLMFALWVAAARLRKDTEGLPVPHRA